MNGFAQVTVKGKTYALLFGMFGCGEFERLLVEFPSQNKQKMLVDMIHGGLFGYAMAEGLAMPDYKETVKLFEEFVEEPDYVQQATAFQEVYFASKWGMDLVERSEKLKKKAEAKS